MIDKAISIAIYAVAILLSLTFHEYAHGRVAYRLGDDTAKRMGRLTLNPIPHLDPFGTLMMVLSIASGVGIGWAKPVPVNPMNFNGDRKKGMLWVALAGPLTNLTLALIAIFLWYLVDISYLKNFLELLAMLNISLAIFNLIPVPPLDGSKILAGVLPWKYAGHIYQVEKYGIIVLLIIVFAFPGFLGMVLGPPVQLVLTAFSWLAQTVLGVI